MPKTQRIHRFPRRSRRSGTSYGTALTTSIVPVDKRHLAIGVYSLSTYPPNLTVTAPSARRVSQGYPLSEPRIRLLSLPAVFELLLEQAENGSGCPYPGRVHPGMSSNRDNTRQDAQGRHCQARDRAHTGRACPGPQAKVCRGLPGTMSSISRFRQVIPEETADKEFHREIIDFLAAALRIPQPACRRR